MLSRNLKEHLKLELEKETESSDVSLSISPVYGGAINRCYQLTTKNSRWFLKVNDAIKFPNMFETEFNGMNLLSAKSNFNIPKMLCSGTYESESFLVMEFIVEGQKSSRFWENFGERLAHLHLCTQDSFGLDYANYIGSLSQSNIYHDSWIDFFAHERLLPQIELAKDQNLLDQHIESHFSILIDKLNILLPEEPPALLHGDLWNGNFMVNSIGEATIFDPAIYYGHREMDIAMTHLFGGFDESFYKAYNQVYQLENGWKDRIDIFNLYPLLVHLNLFGGGYLNQIRFILKQFV